MAAVLLTPPYLEFVDENGTPYAGGLVYAYAAGTSTPQDTYTDSTGLVANTNPVVLDSAGRATIWLAVGGSYKFVVKTSAGVTVSTTDNVTAFNTASGLSVLGTIAANTIVGNNTGSGATPSALTVDQVNAMLTGSSTTTKVSNGIINGDFRIWQRSTTYALTTTVAYGSADRWAFQMATSAAGIANRDASVPTGLGFQYSLKVGRTAASVLTGAISATHALESIDTIPLQGKTITISFYAKKGADFSGASSNLSLTIAYGTGTDQTAASFVAATWTGQTTLLSQNTTLTTTWTRYSYSVSVPSTATQIGFQFYYAGVGTAGADDNFYITGVKAETGTVASPFEFRPIGDELELCHRYYQKSASYSIAPFTASDQSFSAVTSVDVINTAYICQVSLRTSMRTTPTVVTYPYTTPTNTGRCSNGSGTDYGAASASTAGITTEGFGVLNGSGATLTKTANQLIMFGWTASAEL